MKEQRAFIVNVLGTGGYNRDVVVVAESITEAFDIVWGCSETWPEMKWPGMDRIQISCINVGKETRVLIKE